MLAKFHRTFGAFLFLVFSMQYVAAFDIGSLAMGTSNFASNVLSHTDTLNLIKVGLRESDEGGKTKLKPYIDHISKKEATKVISVGLVLWGIAKTFPRSTDSYRYKPDSNMYRSYGDGGSEEGDSYTGNVDAKGNPYRPEWAQKEHDAKKSEELRRKQGEADREYEERRKCLIEEEQQRLSDAKLRKEQQQRALERSQEQAKRDKLLEEKRADKFQTHQSIKFLGDLPSLMSIKIPSFNLKKGHCWFCCRWHNFSE